MKKVLACYVLSNVASVNIHKINENEGYLIASLNNKEREQCPIFYGYDDEIRELLNFNELIQEDIEDILDEIDEYSKRGTSFFIYGRMIIPLDECIKINTIYN